MIAKAIGNRRSSDWKGLLAMTARLDGGRPADEGERLARNWEVVLERAVTVDPDEPVRLDVGTALITAADVVVEEDVAVIVVVAAVTEVNWTVCLAGTNGPREDGPLYPLDAMTAREARRTPAMMPIAKFTLIGDYPRWRRS
jgi:hypothetical protein